MEQQQVQPFLSADFWNPIGAIFTIIGVIVTIVFFIVRRQRRELTIFVVSDTEAVSIKKKFKDKVKILYDGDVAETLQLIVFKIVNTGNMPILKTDFDEPLTFVDGKKEVDGKIMGYYDINFASVKPLGLKPDTIVHNERYGLAPMLLNPGDCITVELTNIDLDKQDAKLGIQGRIVGVKQIKVQNESSKRYSKNELLFTSSASVFLLGLLVSIINLSPIAALLTPILGSLVSVVFGTALASEIFKKDIILKRKNDA